MQRLLFAGMVVLAVAGCNAAQEKTPPARAEQNPPLQSAADWRERMQRNHNADSSIARQVRRLTADLDLTAAQQAKVRELSKWHNATIQGILDTAPPTLTYMDFQTQVHAISRQYHDSVNAILTPRQLQLMKSMVGRLDSGNERRRTQ